ncbi:hypothetical protein D9M72_550180 [compost metagenome]
MANAGNGTAMTASYAPCSCPASGDSVARRSAPAESRTTSIPSCQAARARTMDFQCTGRSSRSRIPGSASSSSCSRLLVFATQLSRTRPDSSTLSASGPYQVSRGEVEWPDRSAVIRSIAGILMPTSCHGARRAGRCQAVPREPGTARRVM